jgi:hypothetical protein
VGVAGLTVLAEPTDLVAGFSEAGVVDRAVEPEPKAGPVVRAELAGLTVLEGPTDLVAGFSEVGVAGEAVTPVLEKRPVVLPAPDAGLSETAVADGRFGASREPVAAGFAPGERPAGELSRPEERLGAAEPPPLLPDGAVEDPPDWVLRLIVMGGLDCAPEPERLDAAETDGRLITSVRDAESVRSIFPPRGAAPPCWMRSGSILSRVFEAMRSRPIPSLINTLLLPSEK